MKKLLFIIAASLAATVGAVDKTTVVFTNQTVNVDISQEALQACKDQVTLAEAIAQQIDTKAATIRQHASDAESAKEEAIIAAEDAQDAIDQIDSKSTLAQQEIEQAKTTAKNELTRYAQDFEKRIENEHVYVTTNITEKIINYDHKYLYESQYLYKALTNVVEETIHQTINQTIEEGGDYVYTNPAGAQTSTLTVLKDSNPNGKVQYLRSGTSGGAPHSVELHCWYGTDYDAVVWNKETKRWPDLKVSHVENNENGMTLHYLVNNLQYMLGSDYRRIIPSQIYWSWWGTYVKLITLGSNGYPDGGYALYRLNGAQPFYIPYSTAAQTNTLALAKSENFPTDNLNVDIIKKFDTTSSYKPYYLLWRKEALNTDLVALTWMRTGLLMGSESSKAIPFSITKGTYTSPSGTSYSMITTYNITEGDENKTRASYLHNISSTARRPSYFQIYPSAKASSGGVWQMRPSYADNNGGYLRLHFVPTEAKAITMSTSSYYAILEDCYWQDGLLYAKINLHSTSTGAYVGYTLTSNNSTSYRWPSANGTSTVNTGMASTENEGFGSMNKNATYLMNATVAGPGTYSFPEVPPESHRAIIQWMRQDIKE